jgi:hypothetical protein
MLRAAACRLQTHGHAHGSPLYTTPHRLCQPPDPAEVLDTREEDGATVYYVHFLDCEPPLRGGGNGAEGEE